MSLIIKKKKTLHTLEKKKNTDQAKE